MTDTPEMSERERLARDLCYAYDDLDPDEMIDSAMDGFPRWQAEQSTADRLIERGWHHTRAQPVADERIAEIEARANAATAMIWTHYENQSGEWCVDRPSIDGDEIVAEQIYSGHDATFIAHAREDIPYLLSAYRAALARVGELERLNDVNKAMISGATEAATINLKRAEAAEARLTTATARAEAAEQRERGLRELLEWLHRRGGLGLDIHERIRAALATTEPTA